MENNVPYSSRKKILVGISVCLMGLCTGAKAQTVNPDFTDGWVYAKINDNSGVELPLNGTDPEFNAIVATYGIVSVSLPFSGINSTLDKTYRIVFTEQEMIDDLIADLQNLSYIEYAEKSPLYKTTHVPNDLQASQWSLLKINAPAAWDHCLGSTAVTIAIVDNAVSITHEDLAANIWNNPNETDGNLFDDDLNGYTNDMHGWDVADNDNNPNPPAGIASSSYFIHGTHCAGIASAATNNSKGVASIGYNIKIIGVKCSKNSATDGGQSLPYAYDGVTYAIRAGADVISMSWGGNSGSFITGANIISAAHNLGIVLVAACGNENSATPFYPAAYDHVIGVGATDQNDMKAGFSNYGSAVDVMAPGVSIYSTLGNNVNAYGFLSGTSMACPLVAGLSGLLISFQTSLVPDDVEMFLKAGCDNIDNLNTSYAGQLGTGRINAGKTFAIITNSEWFDTERPFFIFPNPNNGQFSLYYNQRIPEFNLSVYDTQGKLVFSKETIYNERIESIDLSNFPSGMYMIQITSDTSSWAEKMVID